MKKQSKPVDSEPITQGQLDKRLSETEAKFDTKFESFSQELVKEISDLFNDKIDRITTTQDKLLKKFETWEQENEIGANQIRELRVDVKDHEKRLVKLETKN